MKVVTAVISPHKLGDVKEALQTFCPGQGKMTISNVHGTQQGRVEVYRGIEYVVDAFPKIRIEVVCDLFDAEDIAAVIVVAARSGRSGDGAVWISEVDRFIRIRTGEIDTVALR